MLLLSFQLCARENINVIPFTQIAPSFDGKFDQREWSNALKLTSFTVLTKKSPALRPTELYLAHNNKMLFCAVIADGEDVVALMKMQDSDAGKSPWQLNGIEVLIGGKNNFAQLAFDYMGRLYKNFDTPVFSKANHMRNRYVIRFALNLENIPYLPESDRIFRCNFYRKSPGETSSLFPNPQNNFMNMDSNGYFFLDTPGNIASSQALKYKQQVAELLTADGISAEDASALDKLISGTEKNAKAAVANIDSFLTALHGFSQIQNTISQAQLKKMKGKFGNNTLALFEKKSCRNIPEPWKPVKLLGKDYWYCFLIVGSAMKEIEDAGLMNLPLFKNGMFRIWGELAGKNMMPGGKYYDILQKYPDNPFVISAPFGQLTVPVDHHAITSLFDPEYMRKFNSLYGKRFAGSIMDESYFCDTGVFKDFLQKFRVPLPKNREQAFAAFKKLHDLSGDTPIHDVPTRNAWSTSNLTKQYVGNGAATSINHLTLSLGDTMSGNENGECCGNNPAKIAVARGAARQFGKPWRNYQIFYGWAYLYEDGKKCPGGLQCATGSIFRGNHTVSEALTPNSRWRSGHGMNGLYCGLSLERQKAVYLYPWLNGAGMWLSEGELDELTASYELEKIDRTDPLVINLRDQKAYPSPMVKIHTHFYDNIVMKRDRGVAVTPVALVWDRAHGYLPLYFGQMVWDFFTPNEMEKCMWAIEKHLFRPLEHNVYYGTCRYGDIFDVVTNDAKQEVLDSYKVVYPVGDVTFDKAFATRIMNFVKNGGIFIVNTENLKKHNPFPEDFLGIELMKETGKSPATFSRLSNTVVSEEQPYAYTPVRPVGAEVLAVTTDIAQMPAITANRYGKGTVIVTTPANMKVAGSMEKMLNLFDELMAAVRRNVIDIRVKTPMQYMIAKNQTSWIIYLQNNDGIPPGKGVFREPLRCDTSRVASAEIVIPVQAGRVKKVIDWWSGKELEFKESGEGAILRTTIPGGDCQALEFVLK